MATKLNRLIVSNSHLGYTGSGNRYANRELNRKLGRKGVCEMSDKMYSIRELADRNKVTKAAVRKLMDDEFRENHTQQSGNRILIDEAGAAQIDDHFANQFADTKKEVSSNGSETNANRARARNQTITRTRTNRKPPC